MNKEFDTLVYIGRFQPLHNGHLNILRKAAEIANRVIVIIGSANQPRTFKNPFDFHERSWFIHDAWAEEVLTGDASLDEPVLYVESNIDTIYDDDAWVVRVQDIVNRRVMLKGKVGLIGFKKDTDTIRYLNMFPQWELYDVPHTEVLSATQIRDLYFSPDFSMSFLSGVVPNSTYRVLESFMKTAEYAQLVAEKKYVEAYRKKKEVYEYPIIGVTADAVVVQSGHVLLIKRRSIPGKGLWALPGGYFHAYDTADTKADRTPLDAILRELEEETKIDVPRKVLEGCLKEIRTFCAPGRSLLGRSITFAGHFSLKGGEWGLPKIKGSDDAEKAKWVPLSEVRRELLFDDHADIIQAFVPAVKL